MRRRARRVELADVGHEDRPVDSPEVARDVGVDLYKVLIFFVFSGFFF